MLDIKFIREFPELVRDAITKKHLTLNLDDLLALDSSITAKKRETEDFQAEANRVAKEIPRATAETRGGFIEQGKVLKSNLSRLEPELRELEAQLKTLLFQVPQIPWDGAPVGADENSNLETLKVGLPRVFDFVPLDHVALLEKNRWAETERVARIAGTRSYSLRGDLALLEMSVLRFAVDFMVRQGFELITVPSYAREEAFYAHGQFPSARDQVFAVEGEDRFLAGTAEVLLNSLHSGEMLEESDLPKLYVSISPCFRAEAGAAGKDTRGLTRVHQFNKVEQYVLAPSDKAKSDELFDTMLGNSRSILEALELPYRLLETSTGDMGTGKYRMVDIESWVVSENRYRETHSCSALHDWQARRANLRYRDSTGKPRFCFTLNNTALATPRILVMLLENHQNADGTVNVPAVLQPYMNKKILEPSK
jgi:seryl-tRNA synthetase